MKQIAILLYTLVLTTACISINIGGGKSVRCKGPVIEKNMGFADFNAIVVNGSSDLSFTQSPTFSVKVKANEEVFDYLDYKVEEGVLYIETKEKVNLRADEYDVTLSLPILESITVNGAADVKQCGAYVSDYAFQITVNGAGDLEMGSIKVPEFTCELNGASDLHVKGLDVRHLAVTINGAGDAVLAGKAEEASFTVNGAGDIDAAMLECGRFETHKAGMARVKVGSK